MIEIPSSLQSTCVIGHDEAKAAIESAFDSARMPHAWLITGPEGIGKTTLAVHVAHMLLTKGENRFSSFNPKHPVARLIAAGAHPDFFILKRPVDEKTGILKKTISVDVARKAAPFLHMTASHGGARVALVQEAHKLTVNAQNALLKIIEEPSADSFIIMVATTAASLLPTIRSRCRFLALDPLAPASLETILMRMGADLPSGEDKARFLNLSDGSAGFALDLLQMDGLQIFDELMVLLSDLPAIDIPALHRIAGLLGKKADVQSFEIVTRLLTQTLAHEVKSVALGQEDATGLALKLAPSGRLDKLLDLWEKTRASFAAAHESNLDKKLIFIDAVLEMKRCAM